MAYSTDDHGVAAQTTGTVTLTTASASYQTIAPGGSTLTVNLPPAAASLSKNFIFEQISGTGIATLVANGTDTIEGLATINHLIIGVPIGLISDGVSTWRYLWSNPAQGALNSVLAGGVTNYFGTGADGALVASGNTFFSNSSFGGPANPIVQNYTSIHVPNGTTLDRKSVV